MTEEIKEILENIKKQNEWEGVEYFRTPLSNEDADKLLNCITNLQQEKNYYKKQYHNCKSRIDKALIYLGKCNWNDKRCFENLINILNGSDENEY